MRHWPDDNAHCIRTDCPRSLECIRFVALVEKNQKAIASGWAGSCAHVNDFDPEICEFFEPLDLEVDRE